MRLTKQELYITIDSLEFALERSIKNYGYTKSDIVLKTITEIESLIQKLKEATKWNKH